MRKTPDYALDDQVGYLMRLAGQRHSNIFQTHSLHGLTATQFAALVRLAEVGECSQNALGRKTAMDVATIKGVVDRLRSKGFVAMRGDPKDKRRSILSLAPGHDGLAEALHEVGHQISAATLAPLTPVEQTQFLALLKKLG
jgi:DNA-binding MarR family transcriptional regulator